MPPFQGGGALPSLGLRYRSGLGGTALSSASPGSPVLRRERPAGPGTLPTLFWPPAARCAGA